MTEQFLPFVAIGVLLLTISAMVAYLKRRGHQRSKIRTIPGIAIPMIEFKWGAVTGVYAGGSEFGDQELSRLTKFRSLQELQLDHTEVTDEGLGLLKAVPHLNTLWLYQSEIGDSGLLRVSELRVLGVRFHCASSDGFRHFSRLSKLSGLRIETQPLDPRVVAELRASLPNCEIQVSSLDDHTNGESSI